MAPRWFAPRAHLFDRCPSAKRRVRIAEWRASSQGRRGSGARRFRWGCRARGRCQERGELVGYLHVNLAVGADLLRSSIDYDLFRFVGSPAAA